MYIKKYSKISRCLKSPLKNIKSCTGEKADNISPDFAEVQNVNFQALSTLELCQFNQLCKNSVLMNNKTFGFDLKKKIGLFLKFLKLIFISVTFNKYLCKDNFMIVLTHYKIIL